jgi:methionyl-tRNA formyltransferase
VRTEEFADQMRGLGIDVAAVVAFGALLPQRLLDIPEHGWVNLHFSLLPAWRGAAPVQAAIRAGDEITGATTFRLEAGLDTGPVFGVVPEAIRPRDTAGDLLDRLSRSGAGLLAATLDGIADESLHPRPQPTEGVSMAPKVTPADVEINWSLPALAVDRLVRSATPDPGAWTSSLWGRIGVDPVEITDVGGLAPGELAATKHEVLVGTGSTAVRLGSIRPPGRRRMTAADWARGTRPAAGSRLTTGDGPSNPGKSSGDDTGAVS